MEGSNSSGIESTNEDLNFLNGVPPSADPSWSWKIEERPCSEDEKEKVAKSDEEEEKEVKQRKHRLNKKVKPIKEVNLFVFSFHVTPNSSNSRVFSKGIGK
jgi:hypothetical protein